MAAVAAATFCPEGPGRRGASPAATTPSVRRPGARGDGGTGGSSGGRGRGRGGARRSDGRLRGAGALTRPRRRHRQRRQHPRVPDRGGATRRRDGQRGSAGGGAGISPHDRERVLLWGKPARGSGCAGRAGDGCVYRCPQGDWRRRRPHVTRVLWALLCGNSSFSFSPLLLRLFQLRACLLFVLSVIRSFARSLARSFIYIHICIPRSCAHDDTLLCPRSGSIRR